MTSQSSKQTSLNLWETLLKNVIITMEAKHAKHAANYVLVFDQDYKAVATLIRMAKSATIIFIKAISLSPKLWWRKKTNNFKSYWINKIPHPTKYFGCYARIRKRFICVFLSWLQCSYVGKE